MERILRLWYPLRELYARGGVAFPLDEGDNRDCFLQLYSLLKQVTSITRNADNGSLPMNGEMHMTMSKLKIATLNESVPLKVRQYAIVPRPYVMLFGKTSACFELTGRAWWVIRGCSL